MALASQTIRNQSSARAYSSPGRGGGGGGGRRARRRNVTIAAVALVAGGAVGLWWLTGRGESPVSTPETAAAASKAEPQVDPVAVKERPVVEAPRERLPERAGPQQTLAAMNERKPGDVTMGQRGAGLPAVGEPRQSATTPARTPPSDPLPTRDPIGQPPTHQPRTQQTSSQQPPAPTQQPAVTAPAAPPEAAPASAPAAAASATSLAIERGRQLVAQNRPVQAREALNSLLSDPNATSAERDTVKRLLAEVSQTLTFGPQVVEGDGFAFKYEIKPGDSLVKIASRESLGIDWRFLQRINRMTDPGRLQVGQKIKAVRGPFHAVVSKGGFRLDLYQGSPPALSGETVVNAAGGATVFIASFPVGLGEFGSTPTGAFMVKQNSRLVNPAWRNPRTGEQFTADDPKNPIGERWVGLAGIEERTRSLLGYGLHGTIEPESIGSEKSMGCVRMLHDDICLIYELMTEGVSTVQIVP